LAHGVLSQFATQQLLIYQPHLRNADTLPWEISQAHNDAFSSVQFKMSSFIIHTGQPEVSSITS